MPNVLVLGATGTVGSALAASLVRGGNHCVWGLARTEEKGLALARDEITPVVGDVSDTASWAGLLASAPIDIVVNCSSAYAHEALILETVREHSSARRSRVAAEGFHHSPKLGFVNLSGVWVHGDTTPHVNDLHLPGTCLSRGTPATLTEWRPLGEQQVLVAADTLDVAIVRPGVIHGHASRIYDAVLSPLHEAATSADATDESKTINLPISQSARLGVVHIDDVTSGLHAVVDRVHGQLGSWPVYDLITQNVSIVDLLDAVKAALGLRQRIVFGEPGDNLLFQAFSQTTSESSGRAKAALGWSPKRTDIIKEMPVLIAAWRAHKLTTSPPIASWVAN